MSIEDCDAAELLGHLVSFNEQMGVVWKRVQDRWPPGTVTKGTDIRRYGEKICVEFWVDTDANDDLLTWWFEVQREGPAWSADAAVMRRAEHGHGQEKVRDFPDVKNPALRPFLADAGELMERLLATVDDY